MIRTISRLRRLVGIVLVLLLLSSALPVPEPMQASPNSMLQWRDKGEPFGVVASLGNRVRSDEIPQAVALLREAGVQWQREEIFWDRVQQVPNGPFTWTGNDEGFYNYDYAIGAQVAAGINILGLLDYNPAWFKGQNPHPDEWIEDWGDFVYAAVARYGRDLGWVKHWELWNEPNLANSGYHSGLYRPADFVRLLQVGQAAAQAADPEAKIVLGGLASIWGVPPSQHNYDYFTYLEIIGDLGAWDYIDIIAIHPYRPDAPEGNLGGRGDDALNLRTELQQLDALLVEHGDRPIWFTELGWPSGRAAYNVDEDSQAFFLVRAYIMALTHPSVEKVFWYDFRNDTDPNVPYDSPVYNDYESEFHYGLLRRTYPLDMEYHRLRKPSFLAYRTMTQMLGNTWLSGIAAENNRAEWPGVYWYHFQNADRRVDVLWRTHDAAPTKTVFCGCREALIRNWNGAVTHLIYADEGVVRLRLDNPGAPVYVEYDPPISTDGEFFAVTGHTIRGAFRDYWYAEGGLHRFGYPLTEELIVPDGHGRPRVVQYFERARFEHYPGSKTAAGEVELARIGDTMLQREGIDWRTLPRVSEAPENCEFFPDVGHSICPPFLQTWRDYDGMVGLGYPLTEAFPMTHPETGESYTVQHFERARLEYYPVLPGQGVARMEFGMLGREYLVHLGGMP